MVNDRCKVGEATEYKDKKSFDKEIEDSTHCGRPIKPTKYIENEHERER